MNQIHTLHWRPTQKIFHQHDSNMLYPMASSTLAQAFVIQYFRATMEFLNIIRKNASV